MANSWSNCEPKRQLAVYMCQLVRTVVVERTVLRAVTMFWWLTLIWTQVVVPGPFISSHNLAARVSPSRRKGALSDLTTKVMLEAPPARGAKPMRWQSVVLA